MKHDFSELRLDHVTRKFAGAGGKAFNDSTSCRSRCARASSSACLGPSGCGKSTALNCIAGLMHLSGGLDLARRPAHRHAAARAARVRHGVPELRAVPHMSVEKNIGFGLRMRGVARARSRRASPTP
jgi:putative spermidine/putrescine transport system ATP-binding protein